MKAIKILSIITLVLFVIEIILIEVLYTIPGHPELGLAALFTFDFTKSMILVAIIATLGYVLVALLISLVTIIIMTIIKKKKTK